MDVSLAAKEGGLDFFFLTAQIISKYHKFAKCCEFCCRPTATFNTVQICPFSPTSLLLSVNFFHYLKSYFFTQRALYSLLFGT